MVERLVVELSQCVLAEMAELAELVVERMEQSFEEQLVLDMELWFRTIERSP